MTKIDFYIAPDNQQNNALTIACRVAEKAWRRGHSIYVHTDNQQMAEQFDEKLWSFRPNSFVPHRVSHSADLAPENIPDILIGCDENAEPSHEVLLNLSNKTPAFLGRFKRVAEFVDGHEEAKVKSRERFKYYKTRGYPLDVHHL